METPTVWIRVHVRWRKEFFVPFGKEDADDGVKPPPGSLQELRTTHFVTRPRLEKKTVHHNYLLTGQNVPQRTRELWHGRSVFFKKANPGNPFHDGNLVNTSGASIMPGTEGTLRGALFGLCGKLKEAQEKDPRLFQII